MEMPGPPAIYECACCHARREVTLVDDDPPGRAAAAVADRDARLRTHLRHATCPACGGRDPEAVAANVARRRRGRFAIVASYAAMAAASAFVVPMLALAVPIIMLLIWFIVLGTRRRRGLWLPIVVELLLSVGSIVWIVAAPRHAYLVPAAIALLALWPQADAADPFAAAAEQLRFVESPYRG